MTLSSSKFAICISAICLGGAAPYATSWPALPRSQAAVRAYADQLRHAWLAHHPEDTEATMTAPKILSGTVTTATVDVTSTAAGPGVQIKFATDKSGMVYAQFMFTGPAGALILVGYSPGNFPSSGNVTLLNATLSLYQPAGTYTLAQAYIASNDGGVTEYDSTEAAKLLSVSSFQLTNPNASDVTAPTLSGGRIATKSVSLASAKPAFVMDLTVSDDVSGVAYCYFNGTDPNNNFFNGSGYAPTPIVTAARLPLGLDFERYFSTPTTGTWTVTEIACYDVAGHGTYVSGTTAIKALLGSDTFTVTD